MRKIWDIHGGIHPPENKHQSMQGPIRQAGIPPQLVLPLAQHIGAPANPVVAVGQRVLKGQMIAEAKGFVSAPVHAPTSGVVVAIESRLIPHPSGMSAPCIVIDTDGRDEWIGRSGVDDFRSLERSKLLERIRAAGIAGMGGAGFPSAVKLGKRDGKPIETLILNGTECEPYITADDALMRERADQIIAGAEILRYLVEPTKETLIGVEDNKPEGIAALQKAAAGTGIEIVVFPTKYPSGGEKQLIEILTGKEVPNGGLPADIGIVCQNVGTAVAIHKAIHFGEPLISRITTVTGDACQQPGNFETLLGTPVQFLLELSGFDQSKCIRLIMGGPMMGYTLNDTAVPVVKTANCVLAPTARELPPPPPAQACIRCGMCSEACPVSLLPQQMYWFARAQEHDKLEAHNLFDCIECGACSYVCPSSIPLVQYYRAAKGEIRQAQQDKIKAERSKERFEARQARLEKEEAEKEARRKARLEAAKQKSAASSEVDPIQAAIERSKAKKADAQTTSQDPAQAAIARAQAARSGSTPTESPAEKTARLEKQIASAEKRLSAAQEKHQQALTQGDANADAFAKAVSNTEQKLESARQELAAHQAQSAPPSPPPTAEADPAAAAIARAQAKRAGGEVEETNEQKTARLQQAVAASEKKLLAAQEKLDQARSTGDSKVAAFETAVDKLSAKLAETKQALSELEGEAPATTEPSTDDDPAQAAIKRAQAAREAAASMTDADKLKANVASLEKRLAKTREKLSAAKENGDDTADLLADTVAKLEDKLAQAQQQLAEHSA
ncbi:electron transport complex subunit RsxC [Spongiibacter taiwanensis]|uniref:electron transport complex subunit RsxC n=1 Tax=Spongiibacter taiwanensis TaxID=1748242 RepID=UPI00203653D9|nr:electron transport complex subunit RsxC [Spongiibacter taiwanensis]USA43937.1 electron transport complex subunit RsxC [Spongiibacter taiwanensis]